MERHERESTAINPSCTEDCEVHQHHTVQILNTSNCIPVLVPQKYDPSINQLFLFLNPISVSNDCKYLQQLKLGQRRVSDGCLWFLFCMNSSISLLSLSVFLVPVLQISTANPNRLWRPRVGIDQFKCQKLTLSRGWTNRHKAQSRK